MTSIWKFIKVTSLLAATALVMSACGGGGGPAAPAALAVTTASPLPGATVGTAYSQTLAATAGTTPYTWSISAGALPAGLSLNASTGVISGTPTTAGTANFTVMVTDSASPVGTATKALSIVVAAPAAKSTSLSGTAAAGAPIIGSVTIKDSSSPAQEKTVPIEANGHYTVDVSDMTAPYMVRADGYVGGNEYHLYSAGTSADVGGTINITPLTDLIVANIAGSIAQTYFDSGEFSTLTAEQLTAESDALKAKLLPVLQAVGVSDSIDLLRASFSTDHTGLDAALDVLRVTTDTTEGVVATITNIITHQQMTSNITTGTYTGALTDTTGVATGVTDIQAISAGFKRFSDLFATSVPQQDNPTLLALFDSATFMMEGENLAAFLSEITTDQGMIGISFANISIQSINTATGTALVAFDVIQNGKLDNDGPKPFYMIKKADGKWYMQGDQYIAHINIEPRADYQPNNTSAMIQTGFNINIEDRGAQGITSAVVTGAGLTSPVTLVRQINTEWFAIQGNMYNGNMYWMNDSQIAAIADTGEVYTVQLYKGSTLAATYTETIKKRPYLNTELTAAMFPTITSPSMSALMGFMGGAITVSWALPSGLTVDWVEVQLSDATGSNTARAEYDPLPTATSKTFDLPATSNNGPFTPTNRMIWVNASDAYGRVLTIGI